MGAGESTDVGGMKGKEFKLEELHPEIIVELIITEKTGSDVQKTPVILCFIEDTSRTRGEDVKLCRCCERQSSNRF